MHKFALLYIEEVNVKINTEAGFFGRGIKLSKGLNVLRAENASGKSTLVNMILYGLGMEILLGRKGLDSVKPVLKDNLDFDGKKYLVTESVVLIELENYMKKKITVRRYIKSSKDHRLVTVFENKSIDEIDDDTQGVDYFLHDPGAAQHEMGFQYYLTNDFLNLQLPDVPTYQDSIVPLYFECVFPLFFIEQRRGWSDIQATIPSIFRVKNPSKRAIEYVLKLETIQLENKKTLLESMLNDYKSNLSDYLTNFKTTIENAGGLVTNFPKEKSIIQELWNPEIRFLYEGVNYNLRNFLLKLNNELDRLKKRKEKKEDNTEEITGQLNKLEEQLLILESQYSKVRSEVFNEENNLKILKDSLKDFTSDLVKIRDLLKIKKFGGEIKSSMIKNKCPTCSRPLKEMLLDQNSDIEPMTLEENRKYISQKAKTTKNLIQFSGKELVFKNSIMIDIEKELGKQRQKIHDLNLNLREYSDSPNISKIRSIILLEEKIINIKLVREKLSSYLANITKIALKINEIIKEMKQIPKDLLSDRDKEKLRALEKSVISKLSTFHFRSTALSEIEISQNTYHPRHFAFEKIFLQSSESDNIRLIWAYTLALLELSERFDTNHSGFLVFDEPMQQGIDSTSLFNFFKILNKMNPEKSQSIVTTSQNKEEIKNLQADLGFSYFELGNKVFTPLHL